MFLIQVAVDLNTGALSELGSCCPGDEHVQPPLKFFCRLRFRQFQVYCPRRSASEQQNVTFPCSFLVILKVIGPAKSTPVVSKGLLTSTRKSAVAVGP